FGLALDPSGWKSMTRLDVIRAIQAEARRLYNRKEAEFPVRVGLSRYISDKTPGAPIRIDREGLAAWASERLGVAIDAEDLKTKLRPEIEAYLLERAAQSYRGGALADELEAEFQAAYGPAHAPKAAPDTRGLAAWAHHQLGIERTADELAAMPR